MLNSTVELMTLWVASSSPSLLAFCASHVIIVVLLLGGRGCAPGVNGRAGERVSDGSEAETPDAAQIQGSKRSRGGEEDPVNATAFGSRGFVSEVHGAAEECSVEAGEVDAGAAFRTQDRDRSSGRDGASIAADTSQEKCGGEEDELMMRAEEFIQRMNRVWRTENVRVC